MVFDLLVCHHPLFLPFRSCGVGIGFSVVRFVRKLNRAGCALWVGHTNADAAYRGVGMAAADMFGLVDQRPLVPIDDPDASIRSVWGVWGVLPNLWRCVISPVE